MEGLDTPELIVVNEPVSLVLHTTRDLIAWMPTLTEDALETLPIADLMLLTDVTAALLQRIGFAQQTWQRGEDAEHAASLAWE